MHIQSKSTYILLSFLVLIALVVRIIVFFNTDHLDSDSWFRIGCSYSLVLDHSNLLKYWGLITTGIGDQIGYYSLNILIMHFVDEPILVARFTSLIFGILVIIPYYLLIKLAFSQEIAWASTFALVFYPTHVQLSVDSMANAGCLFFVILALYFLMRYLYNEKSKSRRVCFIASIISTILATAFRMEAWLLIILFPSVLLKERRFKSAILFLVFSSPYVITILFLSYRYMGSPFYLINNSLAFYGSSISFTLLAKRILLNFFINSDTPLAYYSLCHGFIWFGILFYTFSIPLSSLGFWGMLNTFRNKKTFVFLLNFWTFFIMLTVRYLISNNAPFPRYSYIFTIFLIPFIFVGINKIIAYVCRIFSLKIFYKGILAVSFFIACLYFSLFSVKYLGKHIPSMKYDSQVYKLSDWMGRNIRSGDIIICPFDNSQLSAVELLNKFISIDNSNDLGKIILNRAKGCSLDKSIIDEIVEFVKSPREMFSEDVQIRLLIKRGYPWEARRIVFILNEYDYNYLKDNFPVLFRRLGVKYDGFCYSSILTLYDF